MKNLKLILQLQWRWKILVNISYCYCTAVSTTNDNLITTLPSCGLRTVCVLVLADLFDILLPMLNIYQEFVRNHQYSLQVLANCKQNRDFDKLLKQYESNAACEGRMLETFLTYPMFQVDNEHQHPLVFTNKP